MDESFPASEAKKQYFLTTQDLLDVPYKSDYWGFGTGRPVKWYKCEDLEAAALQKHGAQVLAKKRAARKKRQENQRLKALAASQAEKELENEENAPPATVVSVKTLKQLRKDIIKAFKPLVTWDYLRLRKSPHGCNAAAQVPRVQQAEYAALIGRPTDPMLKSVLKSGAWYSTQVPYETLLASDEPIKGKGGRYGCNGQLGIDPSSDVTVKFKPSDNTLSVTAYVQHVDTFEA